MNASRGKGRASENVAENVFSPKLLVPHGYPNGSEWNSRGWEETTGKKKFFFNNFVYFGIFFLHMTAEDLWSNVCETLSVLSFSFFFFVFFFLYIVIILRRKCGETSCSLGTKCSAINRMLLGLFLSGVAISWYPISVFFLLLCSISCSHC